MYLWADGVYSGLRAEDAKLCALVIIGVDEQGQMQRLKRRLIKPKERCVCTAMVLTMKRVIFLLLTLFFVGSAAANAASSNNNVYIVCRGSNEYCQNIEIRRDDGRTLVVSRLENADTSGFLWPYYGRLRLFFVQSQQETEFGDFSFRARPQRVCILGITVSSGDSPEAIYLGKSCPSIASSKGL